MCHKAIRSSAATSGHPGDIAARSGKLETRRRINAAVDRSTPSPPEHRTFIADAHSACDMTKSNAGLASDAMPQWRIDRHSLSLIFTSRPRAVDIGPFNISLNGRPRLLHFK